MRRSLRLALLSLTSLALVGAFLWMRSLASWRPVKLGKLTGYRKDILFFSGDERTILFSRPTNSSVQTCIGDIISGTMLPWPESPESDFNFSSNPPELTAAAERKDGQGELRVREVCSGHLNHIFHWPLRTTRPFSPSVLWSPEGETIMVVDGPNLYQWNLKSGKLVHNSTLKSPSFAHGGLPEYAPSPHEDQLIGCTEGLGKIWQVSSGKLLRSWTTKAHGFPVFFSPDARVAVYTSTITETEAQPYEFVDTATGKVTWKSDNFISISNTAMQGGEIFFLHKTNCEVLDVLSDRLKLQLPGPRQSNGEILRVTHDWIYTLNSKGEILRWRAR